MKKVHFYFYLLAILVAASPVLHSCNDDNEHSLGEVVRRMATIRVISGNTYYLEIDNGQTLWPSATRIPWYKPVDGQRTIVVYTPLGHLENYDEAICVNGLFNVLTKQVEELTTEDEDEYGDDPVMIEHMWIGANFLNIQFVFYIPSHTPHRVSLVLNTTTGKPLVDEEGYINLEYRYNNFNNVTSYLKRSYVSYNLGEYGPLSETLDGVKGLKVRINSAKNGETTIKLNYKDSADETKIDSADDAANEGLR